MMEKNRDGQKMLTGRACYGHLGGTLGNRLFAQMITLGWFEPDGEKKTVYRITPAGEEALSGLGVDIFEHKRIKA